MPTAPLYYQPIVQAAIQSVPLGSSTLGDVARQQAGFVFVAPAPGQERQIHPVTDGAMALATDAKLKGGVEQTMTGIAGLTDARRGAQLDGVNLNFTDEGYIANRTLMELRSDPSRLDMASPDEAAAMAQGIMQQIARGGVERPMIRSGMLDLPANISNAIVRSWQKEAISDEDVAAAGLALARSIEDADLPIAQSGSWMGEAASLALATWNGSVTAASRGMGFGNDADKIEQVIGTWRGQAIEANPAVGSLVRLLGMSGLSPTDTKQRDAARMLLSGSPGMVAYQLAEAVGAKSGLPADRVEWLAGRIDDIGGKPGNLDGLVAEIAAIVKREPAKHAPPAPAPVEPSGFDD